MSIHDIINSPALSIALVGVVGSIAFSLKEVPTNIFKFIYKKIQSRFIYTAIIYEYDDLFQIIEGWLYQNHNKEYREVEVYLSKEKDSTLPGGDKIESPKLLFKQAPNMFSISHLGKTLFVIKEAFKMEHAQTLSQLYAHKYVIKGWRAKESVNSLLNQISQDYFSSLRKDMIHIYYHDGSGYWGIANKRTVKPLDKIILNQSSKGDLIKDIDKFLSSKQWYTDTSIPYKRTYVFEGPPGTGKTSLCMAIASYTGRSIYVMDINALESDIELRRAFSGIESNSMIVIEDIDAIMVGRSSKTGVSYSCLLNCTDGISYKEGTILCITTNHIENLDPALLRPGRTDKIITVGNPGIDEINQFLSLFYGTEVSMNIDKYMPILSMSAIQEICITNRHNMLGAITEIETRLHKKEVA